MNTERSKPLKSGKSPNRRKKSRERERLLAEDQQVFAELKSRDLLTHRIYVEDECDRCDEVLQVTKGRGTEIAREKSASANARRSEVSRPILRRHDQTRRDLDAGHRRRVDASRQVIEYFLHRAFDGHGARLVVRGGATATTHHVLTSLAREVEAAIAQPSNAELIEANEAVKAELPNRRRAAALRLLIGNQYHEDLMKLVLLQYKPETLAKYLSKKK